MILEKVFAHASDTPTSVAIIDDRRTLTYLELVMGANLFAGHVEKLAPDADKIGLLIPPSAAFAVAFGGSRWLNRVVMPLNYLLKPAELIGIVQDSGLKVLFTIRHFQPLAEAIAAATGLHVLYMEDLAFDRMPGNRNAPARGAHDTAVIMYTSGTSGVPKGVMLTNENLESNALDSCEHARFNSKTVFLGILPMFHTLGLLANMLIPLMLGSKVIYQARFSPMGVFEAAEKHKIEVLVAVPTMYAVLANAKSGDHSTFASLRIAVSGGEALPVSIIEAFHKKFGVTIMEGFGLTETSPILALSVPWAHKPGSVGKLIPQTQIKILDDNDQPLGANQEGLLLFKGPQVMKGYYNKPQETAAVISPDGWFNTGDIGKIDDEGYLYITGRKKDMIIMAGEKVFPREIEDAIKNHPAVLIVAVIGVKDSARGEMPVAFIELKPDLPADQKPTANDIRNLVREKIAPYKAPREVYFVESLPKNATGKVIKRELVHLIPA